MIRHRWNLALMPWRKSRDRALPNFFLCTLAGNQQFDFLGNAKKKSNENDKQTHLKNFCSEVSRNNCATIAWGLPL